MTVWKTLEEECFAVAIYSFAGVNRGPSPPLLPLCVGQIVRVLRRTDQWYWGRTLTSPREGAFPAQYVVFRECTVTPCGVDGEVAVSASTGVAHEIAITLREWMPLWKKLYVNNQGQQFKFVEVSMRALIELRAQATAGAVSQDRLRRLLQTVHDTVDKTDRILGVEARVRDEGGKPVDEQDISLTKLSAYYEKMSGLDSNTDANKPPTSKALSVCVRVLNLVRRDGGSSSAAQLLLSLYNSSGNPISEPLAVVWPNQHTHAPRLLFTELTTDIRREKVFLVCFVTTLGPVEPPGNENSSSRRVSVSASLPLISSANHVRRPNGVACADISRTFVECDDSHIAVPFYSYEKESLDTLVRKLISNKEAINKESKNPQALWVTVQLIEGDYKQMLSTGLGPSQLSRRMGLAEQYEPSDARNDLYVTIMNGHFHRKRNVEVTLKLVKPDGSLLNNALWCGSGPMDEYRSVVYYHEERPRWGEVVKVGLQPDLFREARLLFEVRHRSSSGARETERCVSHLRLMQNNGVALREAIHELSVFKADSDEAVKQIAALPERKKDLPPMADKGLHRNGLSLNPKDVLVVHTLLASTKLTQKEQILGVLKWNARVSEGTLKSALKALLPVPNEDIVNFLPDILDALFTILTQVEEEYPIHSEDSYSVLVLECLLKVFSLVADHKYQHFSAVLHHYINNTFCNALAYQRLLDVVVWWMCGHGGQSAMRILLSCMKNLQWVSLVARASLLQRWALLQRSPKELQSHCDPHVRRLFEALSQLMKQPEHALTAQGAAMKFLPSAVASLADVYPNEVLCQQVVSALVALPRLGRQRVACLCAMCKGPLAKGSRSTLLRATTHHAAKLLHHANEKDCRGGARRDKAARLLGADTSALHDYHQYSHTTELCVEVLGEAVSLLGKVDAKNEMALRLEIAEDVLEPLLKAAEAQLLNEEDHHKNTLLRRTFCVALDMACILSPQQFATTLSDGPNATTARRWLKLVRALMAHEPKTDLRPLYRAMAKGVAQLLNLVCHWVRTQESSVQLLSDIFQCLSVLASSPCLDLKQMLPTRKVHAQKMVNEVRRSAANDMTQLWHHQGERKSEITWSVLEWILQMSLVNDERVREVTFPLFVDMVYLEGVDVRRLEGALVERLDAHAELGQGDSQWAKRIKALSGDCAVLKALSEAACALFPREANELVHCWRMLQFFSRLQRMQLFVRYAHKLHLLHVRSSRPMEAALALKLHADLLQWSDELVEEELNPPSALSLRASHRRLKEALLLEVAELLEDAQQWQVALQLLKELLSVYEEEQDMEALSRLHGRLSSLYAKAVTVPAQRPMYRVLFIGANVPEVFKGEFGFVFMGEPYEQVGQFSERMLDFFPKAKLIAQHHDHKCPRDGLMYLQINAVEPLEQEPDEESDSCDIETEDGANAKKKKAKIYHDSFTFSRPFFPKDSVESGSEEDEVIRRWTERFFIQTESCLPNSVAWSKVVTMKRSLLSPLQSAIRVLNSACESLNKVSDDTKAGGSLSPLTLRLSGLLDSGVQGGLDKYERLFLRGSYVNQHPEEKPHLEQLTMAIARLLPKLKKALKIHEVLVPQDLEALHAHLEKKFIELEDKYQMHLDPQQTQRSSPECEWSESNVEVHLRRVVDGLSPVHLDRESASRPHSLTSNNESSTSSRSKFFSFNSAQFNPLARYSMNSGSAATNSNNGTNSQTNSLNINSYFSTLQTSPRRRDKRRERARKSDASSGLSQWYTQGVMTNSNEVQSPQQEENLQPAVTSANTVTGPLRELTQELVPERPPRGERNSARVSGLHRHSAASIGTTDSNQDEEEPPPPLPAKSSKGDKTKPDIEPTTRQSYDVVTSNTLAKNNGVPRGSFLYPTQ